MRAQQNSSYTEDIYHPSKPNQFEHTAAAPPPPAPPSAKMTLSKVALTLTTITKKERVTVFLDLFFFFAMGFLFCKQVWFQNPSPQPTESTTTNNNPPSHIHAE